MRLWTLKQCLADKACILVYVTDIHPPNALKLILVPNCADAEYCLQVQSENLSCYRYVQCDNS